MARERRVSGVRPATIEHPAEIEAATPLSAVPAASLQVWPTLDKAAKKKSKGGRRSWARRSRIVVEAAAATPEEEQGDENAPMSGPKHASPAVVFPGPLKKARMTPPPPPPPPAAAATASASPTAVSRSAGQDMEEGAIDSACHLPTPPTHSSALRRRPSVASLKTATPKDPAAAAPSLVEVPRLAEQRESPRLAEQRGSPQLAIPSAKSARSRAATEASAGGDGVELGSSSIAVEPPATHGPPGSISALVHDEGVRVGIAGTVTVWRGVSRHTEYILQASASATGSVGSRGTALPPPTRRRYRAFVALRDELVTCSGAGPALRKAMRGRAFPPKAAFPWRRTVVAERVVGLGAFAAAALDLAATARLRHCCSQSVAAFLGLFREGGAGHCN